MRGTKSPNIIGVTPKLIDEHLGAWMVMINDYFLKSYDKTSSPEESFKTIRNRIAYDDKFFMIAYMDHGIPHGFLTGDVIGEVARILVGYLPPSIKGAEREAVIERALELFDAFARRHEAKGAVFYSYRTPGAHKFMVKRGWEDDMTIYKKEISYGE